MADNVAVTAGSGTTVAADEVVDGTLGTVKVQYVKLMDGTLDGTTKAAVGAAGLKVDASGAAIPITDNSGSLTVDNAGTFATQDSQWYTEDAAAAADPKGPALLAVRRDTLSTSEVSTDGDNIALKATSKGKLHTAAEVYLGDAAAATGSGVMGTTTQRVALATDSPGVVTQRTSAQAMSAGYTLVALPTDNPLPAGTNALGSVIASALPGQEYETVAASQTAQALGATGATGDLINGILVIPATTSPGNVLLLDNATSITVFAGGASSVSNLVPFFIPLGIKSVSGAWKITTGANVSCIGVGDFT